MARPESCDDASSTPSLRIGTLCPSRFQEPKSRTGIPCDRRSVITIYIASRGVLGRSPKALTVDLIASFPPARDIGFISTRKGGWGGSLTC